MRKSGLAVHRPPVPARSRTPANPGIDSGPVQLLLDSAREIIDFRNGRIYARRDADPGVFLMRHQPGVDRMPALKGIRQLARVRVIQAEHTNTARHLRVRAMQDLPLRMLREPRRPAILEIAQPRRFTL